MNGTDSEPLFYLPINGHETQLTILDARGSEEKIEKYLEKIANCPEAVENLPDYLQQRIKDDKNGFVMESYDRFLDPLKTTGYQWLYKCKSGRWLMHQLPNEGEYRFILIGDGWRSDIIEDVVEQLEILKEVVTKDMEFELIERR